MSGPAIAVIPPNALRNVLTGPGSALKKLIIPSTTFKTFVLIFKNCSPTVARSACTAAQALLNCPEADSVIIFNSRSEILARSTALAFIKSITCNVCDPDFPRFSNSADILANWNFPNSCSIALDLSKGLSWSSADCNAIIVSVRFPALSFTIPLRSIPNPANCSVATLVGLMSDAIADLIAFAPSDAFTPPSFIAVK